MAAGESPKPPPLPTRSRLAESTLVETIDGPTPIVELLGKVMPVLTRFPDGRLGFRMMSQVRRLEVEEELVDLVVVGGRSVRLGGEHTVYTAEGGQQRVADLRPGANLEPGWTYPAGYSIRDLPEYDTAFRGREWSEPVVVQEIRPVGAGPVVGVTVRETASYFLTIGVRCRAQA